MLESEDAVALVEASRLFDQDWYSRLAGTPFPSREEAVRHWVGQQAPQASPHPLFEPAWLYPGGRWREHAPDPLSFYLSRPRQRQGSPRRGNPHPSYSPSRNGPLEDWLADHDPGELLSPGQPRDPVRPASVVVGPTSLRAAAAWVRHLARRSPHLTGVVIATTEADHRVLQAVAAAAPSVRVVAGADVPETDVRVVVDPGVAAPRWAWVDPLVEALARPGVAAAQPIVLREDHTVAGPLLVGHPVADVERLDGCLLPPGSPAVMARRVGARGGTVLVTSSRLVGPDVVEPGPAWDELRRRAGMARPGEPVRVREGRQALRWSIDIAAGAGPIGTRWGDWHFARSLAAALDRLGQWVAIDHPETRHRASRRLDDVTVTLRGLERVDPPEHSTNLLWVIYNPDQVDAEEAARHDVVFAASSPWAADRSARWGRQVRPLLQCTDATRFGPGRGAPGDDILLVGNSRGALRPSIEAALAGDVPVTVIGAGWERWLPAGRVRVAATSVPNDQLPELYAGAGLVLNDHWPDMRVEGFVSNRVFDVLATGARLLSDDVAGLRDVLGLEPGVELPTWRTAEDFRRLTTPPYDAHYPSADQRRRLAERVVVEHSFDARAAALLDAALAHRARTASAR